MRAIFIKQATDWQSLSSKLVAGGADPAHALAALQRLNPHLDFARIPNGAVVLVPDRPGLQADAGESIGGDAFTALQAQLNDAVAATVADVRSGHAERLAAAKDVTAVLKSAAVRRLIDNDPDLVKQAEAALAAAKDDAGKAKEAETAMQTLQREAADELAALAKRIG